MATTSDDVALSSELREGQAPVKDRMTTTLFLAALFHGIVILGITFAAPRGDGNPTPTLEVLLLTSNDTRAADNPDAQYLAQRSQEGAGTTDERVRPANPASTALMAEQAGVPDGNSDRYKEAVPGQKSTEIISSRSDRSEVEYRSGANDPMQQAEVPLSLSPTAPRPITTSASELRLVLRGKRSDGTVEIIPDTRASILTPYLNAWRDKVERLGTLNFPQYARNAKTADPVLEVALQADGNLGDAVIVRSSGSKEIDQATLSILRLASPFDPFPSDVRKQYRELRFAYEWQFLGAPKK
ncbi:MAG TPA: TonB family protein [Steroidobacter sp.]|uniref:TonB family protein n=1 Tax=Steroidobacter sp. TaxID=1978227 RepID=UPI002EDB4479